MTIEPETRTTIHLIDFAGPNELVVAYTDNELTVHAIPLGKKLRTIPMEDRRGVRSTTAWSAGRKYFATIDKVLHIYNMTTGELAGSVNLPQGWSPKCLSFSPDGDELAAFCDESRSSHIVCWSTSNVVLTLQHTLERTWSSLIKGVPTLGPQVGWLESKRGWLLAGTTIFDRESGLYEPRFLLPGNRLLVGSKRDSREQFLTIVDIAGGNLEAMVEAVRRGGQSIDAELPPIKTLPRAAPTMELPTEPVAWTVLPDSGTAPRSSHDSKSPISLGRGKATKTVFCSESSHAVRTAQRRIILRKIGENATT